MSPISWKMGRGTFKRLLFYIKLFSWSVFDLICHESGNLVNEANSKSEAVVVYSFHLAVEKDAQKFSRRELNWKIYLLARNSLKCFLKTVILFFFLQIFCKWLWLRPSIAELEYSNFENRSIWIMSPYVAVNKLITDKIDQCNWITSL